MSTEDVSPPPPPAVNSPIAAPIGPGNHERAWNDPPMFATEVNVSSRPPANKLNKRVAHPISTVNSSSSGGSILQTGGAAAPPVAVAFSPQLPPATTGSSSSFYTPTAQFQ